MCTCVTLNIIYLIHRIHCISDAKNFNFKWRKEKFTELVFQSINSPDINIPEAVNTPLFLFTIWTTPIMLKTKEGTNIYSFDNLLINAFQSNVGKRSSL